MSKRRLLLAVLIGLTISASLTAWWWWTSRPEYQLQQALELLKNGDRREAERLAELLQRDLHADEAHFLRARIHLYEAEGQFAQAAVLVREEQLERAGRLALVGASALSQPWVPRRDAALLEPRAFADGSWLGPRSLQREELSRRAHAAMSQAIGEFGQMTSEGALRVEAAALAGDCLVRLGDLRQAVIVFAYVVDQQPDHARAHQQLSSLYFDQGVMHLAIKHAEATAGLNPTDGRPHRMIGLIQKDYEQTPQAIAAYREALERQLHPAVRAEVIQELAELLVDKHADYQEALTLLAECPEPYRDKAPILTLRADCLLHVPSKEAEAVALAERALRDNPDWQRAILLRGRMYLRTEQPEPAAALLEKAIRLDPLDYKAHDQLAKAYRLMANRSPGGPVPICVSQVLLPTALTPMMGHAGAPMLIGLGQTAREQFYGRQADQQTRLRDEIQADLQKLTDLNNQAMAKTWDDKVRYEIALLWLKLDRPALARTWLRAALACNPNNEEVKRALERGVTEPRP